MFYSSVKSKLIKEEAFMTLNNHIVSSDIVVGFKEQRKPKFLAEIFLSAEIPFLVSVSVSFSQRLVSFALYPCHVVFTFASDLLEKIEMYSI